MFHHVEICVRDVAAYVRWFLDVIGPSVGMKALESGAWGTSLGGPGGEEGGYLTVVPSDPRFSSERVDWKRPGLNHLAFRARSRADVDAVHARAVAAGARILRPAREDEPGGRRYSLHLRDPEGLWLEVACDA